MREIINYILEANLALLAFLAAYKLLFKKENAFGLLRMYLLCAILFSLVFPLIHFQNISNENTLSIGKVIPEYWLPEVNINPSDSPERLPTTSLANDTWSVLGWVYIIGVCVASLWLVCQVGYVIILMLNSKSYKIERFRIIESNEDKPTFSFFNLIYIGKSEILDQHEKEQIIRHESIHAKQLHSLDILLVTLVRNFFWFNPFIKTYKDLFIQLHEFEADARAVENSDVNKYCSLLARVALQSHFPIASHFNESLTVKRIEMMRTLKKKIEKWKIAVVLAIVSGCFVAISCNDQLVDEFEKSTLSQTSDYPAEIKTHMANYIKEHPGAKLTYLEGTSQDVDKFVTTPEVKGRIVYEYAYRGDEKKGVLLTDVAQHAEALQTEGQVFMVVEQQPEFSGGFDAFREFMQSNVKYPTEAQKNGESGTVYVSMVINQDGRISDAKVLRGVSQSLDAEALRVINLMPPWTPGKQNGRAVKVRFNIPVKFADGESDSQSSVTKPSTTVDEVLSANYQMKVVQFEKKNNGDGKRFVGKVIDEKGNPLPGLNVIVAGTTGGTTTNLKGEFALETPNQNGTIVFSFVGYDTKSIEF
jgi:TonB family protein